MSAGSVRIIAAQVGGLQEIEAYPTPVPGLVIAEDAERPGHWIVTHQQSGTCVADVNDPEGALHAAAGLGSLGDWTRTATDLKQDAALVAAWMAYMEASDLMDRYRSGPGAVPPEVLREVEGQAGSTA